MVEQKIEQKIGREEEGRERRIRKMGRGDEEREREEGGEEENRRRGGGDEQRIDQRKRGRGL